jgi:hypothetical protein
MREDRLTDGLTDKTYMAEVINVFRKFLRTRLKMTRHVNIFILLLEKSQQEPL